jgi:NADH-quinone oxidoreductase subunit H
MLPIALGYLVVVAGAVLALDAAGIAPTARLGGFVPTYWALLGVLNIVLAVLVFVVLDRGRLVSPASARVGPVELAELRAMALRRPAPVQGD